MTDTTPSTEVTYGPEHINQNDVPTPTAHSVDPTKFSRADIKQLRKNIERLKSISNVVDMKQKSHFDIRQFFPLK